MAASGYTPIQLYYSTTAAAVPVNTNLLNGELAINITDGKLYYKNNSGVVTLLAGATAGPAGGSNTQVQYNSSGVLTGSANLTFNGTTLTANTIGAFTLGGTIAGGGNQINNVIIGTTTPLAGAFTTLSASSTISTGAGGILLNSAGISAGSVAWFGGDSSTTSWYFNAPTGGAIRMGINNSYITALTSTGLAVTGTATSNGYTFNYNTSYWNVDGYLSNYSATNGVYLNGNAGGWLHLNADGTQAARIKLYGSSNATPNIIEFTTASTERLRIAATGAFGLSGANYGTSGQVLTSGGSGAAPTWTTVSGGGGAATPSALGTVYGETDASSPYNAFLGYQAGFNTTTGAENVAMGWRALYENITGSNSVAIGEAALNKNTASNNLAVGYQAAYTNTTGSGITALGHQALLLANPAVSGYTGDTVAVGYRAFYNLGSVASNGSGGCTAVGNAAGYSTTSAGNGAYDTFIGYLAGYYNVSGYNCTFVGAQAGYGQTSGNSNTIVGVNAGRQTSGAGGGNCTFVGSGAGGNNSGNDNTFVGVSAGNTNAGGAENAYFGTYAAQSCTGGQNVAVGKGAMYSSAAANYNTAIGKNSLYSNISGGYHTAVGWNALYSSTDNSNVGIGYQAGAGVVSGHSNTFVGTNAGYGTVITTGQSNIVIGSTAYTNTANAAFEIVIGTGCNGLGNDRVTIGKLNSRIYAQYDSSGTWTYSSDVRLKKDIEDDSLGLSFINKLRPVKFRWKATNELERDNPQYNEVNNKNTTVVMHGLIAQEVKAALDEEGVSTFGGWDVEPNGIQSISREMFLTPLINAIQELSAQVETLKAEVAALKGNV